MINVQLFVIVPTTYADIQYLEDYPASLWYKFCMEADSVGYNCGVMLILTLTIDRFIVFLNKFGRNNRFIRSIALSLLSWIYGIVIMVFNNVYGVIKTYDRENFSFVVLIDHSKPQAFPFITYTQTFSKVLPFIILALYIFCIIRLKKFSKQKSLNSETRKVEKTLLIQGIAFALFYEVEALLFYQRDFIISVIGNDNEKCYLVVLNLFVIMFTCFNSIVLYIFVDRARKHLKGIITCKICDNKSKIKSVKSVPLVIRKSVY
uniref:G_PROTEIN_RECEP_F1_2 domain-containing protein n=1 Tax=Strongyloides papillosus TaxID=174720 RepID=A0A0N5BLA3_STREA